ncbi:MAG: hypothetical protein FWC13_02345 [Oscillospiraceae bacterium]|nr:hypothetical protein [Oscillospiraceae bacterium]
MYVALGLIIGVISGTVQFFLLSRFTGAVTKGKINNKTVIFALTQFLFPFAVLVACAFFIPDSLAWTGVGMGGALVISAVTKFILTSRGAEVKGKK